MLEIINKIEEFLSSDDREMIELGARLMQEYMPQRMWKPVLNEYSTKKEKAGIQYINCYPELTQETEVSVQKWTWYIDENNIIIIVLVEHINSGGIWSQLSTGGYKHTYSTTNFDINILSSAIKTYFNKPTNTTTKWQHNRRKTRQPGWTSLRNK